MHAAFIADCPTGRMTRADLHRIYRQFFPFGDPGAFIGRLLRAFATDDALDFGGFAAAVSVVARGSIDEKISCRLGVGVLWLTDAAVGAFRFCDAGAKQFVTLQDFLECADAVHGLLGLPVPRDAHGPAAAQAVFSRFQAERVDLTAFRTRCLDDPEILQGFIFYDGLV